VKHKVVVIWTLVSSSLVLQIAGQPVYSVGASDLASYPAVSRQVCEESYRGTFVTEPGSRTCNVESAASGRTMYVAFGSERVEWVQTVSYGVPAEPGAQVALGPSSVGCARPEGAANDDWALGCM
jgi:hypothetical protein